MIIVLSVQEKKVWSICGIRGANIMLQNHVIMLCFDARIISLLRSTKQVIMLHK